MADEVGTEATRSDTPSVDDRSVRRRSGRPGCRGGRGVGLQTRGLSGSTGIR